MSGPLTRDVGATENMKKLIGIVTAAFLMGCASPAPMADIARNINDQIIKFNAERIPDMGITPISAKVAQVEVRSSGNELDCLDEAGKSILILQKQPDGAFTGQMRTPYHELPSPDRHSWGEALLDIRIENERLQQSVPAYGAQSAPSAEP